MENYNLSNQSKSTNAQKRNESLSIRDNPFAITIKEQKHYSYPLIISEQVNLNSSVSMNLSSTNVNPHNNNINDINDNLHNQNTFNLISSNNSRNNNNIREKFIQLDLEE